ncbi:MAG: dihydrolipoyl dehydrogenase [Nitrospirota bacterium]|nr:dihydrolipoyl dehydrogenase [Nitrospirota bacterium]
MQKKYDLLILGGGPGGYVSAIRAGQLGLKVAVIEKEAIGGTCLHHGCIPSKAIIRSAEILSLIQNADKFGITVAQVSADFGVAVDRSQKVLQKLYRGVLHLMKKHQVDIFEGFGKIIAPGQIEIEGAEDTQIIQGKNIIIATGSRVKSLPHLPINGTRIITSNEALLRRQLPQSVLIVGGGAIGVEFAYIYSVYGVQVTIAEMCPVLLPTEDHEVSTLLARSFKKRKIAVKTGKRVGKIRDEDGVYTVSLEDERGETENISAEVILVAVGRAANVDKIGLETLGISQEEGSGLIQVDENMLTNCEGIFAIGDVSTRPALAHGAMAQGVFVAERIAGMTRIPIDSETIPSAVYCHPQVASVGLTEARARKAGLAIKIAKFPLSANGKAIALGETEGFVKIIADEKHGEILGAHIIGAEATELIAEFVLAKTLEATASDLNQAIHPHPTLSEAVMEAGGAIFDEAIHF